MAHSMSALIKGPFTSGRKTLWHVWADQDAFDTGKSAVATIWHYNRTPTYTFATSTHTNCTFENLAAAVAYIPEGLKL
jgi:hypothetical protein